MRETESELEEIKRELGVSAETIRKIDQATKKLDTEENQASNLRSQISANLGYRQELREIQRVQKELDEIDLEAAAKARREFNSKYKAMLEDENEKQGKVSGGCAEMGTLLKGSGTWPAEN